MTVSDALRAQLASWRFVLLDVPGMNPKIVYEVQFTEAMVEDFVREFEARLRGDLEVGLRSGASEVWVHVQ